jgi:two-component system chemotaxis sensor kinase CheA
MQELELDPDRLLETFRAETEEQLVTMEEALVALEARPDEPSALQAAFRAVHTLKGNAASLGFAPLAEVAHVVEDLLDRLRVNALGVNEGVVTLLLQAVDTMRQLAPQGAAPEELPGLLGSGSALLAAGHETATSTLRVPVGRLDRMLDLSGEAAVANDRLAQLLQQQVGADHEAVLEAHRDAQRVLLDLQQEILGLRMVPVGPSFRQQLRTLRDAARTSGKLARLQIEGEDVEVDTRIVEQLRGPLTHMVRNALDHGIESPERRAAAGKDPQGLITLRASHSSGLVLIELKDDGGGLDRERIRARARDLMVDAESLGDRELLQLVFEPGFSTAEGVTTLSGRGIGLDVVRRNVEALRGSVEVHSEPGMGSCFRIRVPLTVAIVPGFLVTAGDETYVIPLEAVQECADLPAAAGNTAQLTGLGQLRGAALPYLRLRVAFGSPAAAPARESLVVVTHAGRRAALAVDALLGERQIVLKPAGHLLRNRPGVAGSTILGNGSVALVLDVPALVQSAEQAEAQCGQRG